MVADLCRLPLLDDAQALELTGTLAPQHAEPRELARAILRRGWLTVFQLNQLLLNHGNDLLIGPYILTERLGEGGMGQVFKARHRSLDRLVALKVIRKETLTNPTTVRRFEREVQTNGRLTHPNVVRAFDAGQAGGTYYLAMEFIEGIDLAQLVKQDGPLAVPRACDYICQAALGLQHAHEMGFIHRDIKPANLLLARKTGEQRASNGSPKRPGGSSALLVRPVLDYPWGNVKILDFGLARLQLPDPRNQQVELTQQGTVMGTPDFLAPEQAWDSAASDIRADLYSLGCTFYFLLSGQVPFPGGSVPEKLIRQRNAEPPPVARVRREQLQACSPGAESLDSQSAIPDKVVEVLKCLMAKDPAERYQTPAEAAAGLAAVYPRPSPPAGVVEDTKTPVPRGGKTRTLRRPLAIGQEATIVVARKKVIPPEKLTSSSLPLPPSPSPSPSPRKHWLRGLLVCAGFLLCCALAGRFLASNPLRAEVDKPPAAAPQALPKLPNPLQIQTPSTTAQ
jgi:eukaryotic-like serine/threonine-protein kinase